MPVADRALWKLTIFTQKREHEMVGEKARLMLIVVRIDAMLRDVKHAEVVLRVGTPESLLGVLGGVITGYRLEFVRDNDEAISVRQDPPDLLAELAAAEQRYDDEARRQGAGQ